MDIALITYNNGFNRILKRLETFNDYKQANYEVTGEEILDFDVNFNPNDGLNTEIVIGTSKRLDWLNHGPDYAVLHEGDTVISRWFITGIKRERQGQYRIGLRRDVLAEYKENVLSSPCYVEKGTIRDATDPLLFNAEGMSFNQIKKDQIPLKDQSEMAWLVGYLSKNADSATDKTISYTYPDTSDYDLTDSEVDFADSIEYRDTTGNVVDQRSHNSFWVNESASYLKMRSVAPVFWSGDLYMDIKFVLKTGIIVELEHQLNHFDWDGINSIAMDFNDDGNNELQYNDYVSWIQDWSRYNNGEKPSVATAWKDLKTSISGSVFSSSETVSNNIKNRYEGKRILHDGRVYRLFIERIPHNREIFINGYDAYFAAYRDSLEEKRTINNVTWTAFSDDNEKNKNKAKVELSYDEFIITAKEEPTDESFSFTLPPSTQRNTCPNSQYDMFAMPVTAAGLGFSVDGDDCKDTQFHLTVIEDNTDVEKTAYINAISGNQLMIAQMLSTKLGDHVYDLQLLPYCPIEFVYFNGHNYTTHNFLNGATNQCYLDLMDSKDYSAIMTNGGEMAGIIFWPKNAMFSKNIEISVGNEHKSTEPVTIKNPTLVYNNSNHLGDPIWRLEFPYEAEGSISTSDVTIPSGLNVSWMTVSYSGNGHPCLYITSDQLPQSPTTSQQEILDGLEIAMTATWVFPDDAERLKVQNECEFQRLVSPNFNGMFEFKKCKMLGGVHDINVDCLYKPYSPYIKLNPDFSFLYGRDFNDSTGLILSGDFSLPKMKDAFVEYELQNKNYQAIFARGIENMDVNNEIARDKQMFNGVMGTLTATGAGAVMGLKQGASVGMGPAGALAGAAVGGGMAALTAAANMDFLKRQQNEARDFAIDNYGYQLGNIKAMPQSLSKSTPLTYNNTVWPLLEEYDATDEEKEVLRNKLKYDGMTIMKVATLGEYESEGGYLKGKIIRLNIDANSQVANQIYQEVDKGFYTE